jgi:hypothetical protein
VEAWCPFAFNDPSGDIAGHTRPELTGFTPPSGKLFLPPRREDAMCFYMQHEAMRSAHLFQDAA